MDDNRLTKQIFLWDYGICSNNWSSDVKTIFEILNKDCFDNRSKYDLSHIKETFMQLFQDTWIDSLNYKPKLRTYKLFKQCYVTEDYVSNFMPRYDRSLLSQFRCGILPLRIETGRYTHTKDQTTGNLRTLKPDERICQLCNNGVEDEIHFLCNCTLYDENREVVYCAASALNPNFNQLNTEQRFIYLLQNCYKPTSKYITSCWNIRKEKLFKNI